MNGHKYNHSEANKDRFSDYTRTVGTFPVKNRYTSSATEAAPSGSVPFGSRQNDQNRMKRSQ